jgi:hypothetical protein
MTILVFTRKTEIANGLFMVFKAHYNMAAKRGALFGGDPGQSHLIHPIQNELEIGVVPTRLETPGTDANARRSFLTQQIEANMAYHRKIFVGMAESHA